MSQESIYSYYAIVEEAIAQLGVEPEAARLEQEGNWQLTKGDLAVFIEVWEMETDGEMRPYVLVFSPLFPVSPNASADFLRRALELSHISVGVGYSIFDNYLLLRFSRELADMSVNELLTSLLRVANTAEEQLEELRALHDNSL